MAVTAQTNCTLDELAAFLAAHDDYVICGHVNPDGDCIGSQLALMHALRACGKHAECVLVGQEPLEISLLFLPGAQELVPACEYKGDPQVFIGVDVPNRKRIGEDACKILDRCAHSATIDHHASETTMCEKVYVDPDSASCSMIVWDLITCFSDNPSQEMALCAYTGLVTDTGGFCFQNTDEKAFSSAAAMVAQGVDPGTVARNIFQNRTAASLELDALTIAHLEVSEDKFYAMSWIDSEDIARAGAQKADFEPLVNTVRSLAGIRVACMLREQGGEVRGSLRAKDDTDVAQLARKLGGGGHVAAAGFTLHMDIDQARDLMRRELADLASNLK